MQVSLLITLAPGVDLDLEIINASLSWLFATDEECTYQCYNWMSFTISVIVLDRGYLTLSLCCRFAEILSGLDSFGPF